MSEAKHTPGPWKWDGNVCDYASSNEPPWIVAGALDEVAVLTGEIHCGNPADARLIASAPELLEVLQELVDSEYEFAAVANKARLVIAKATGVL